MHGLHAFYAKRRLFDNCIEYNVLENFLSSRRLFWWIWLQNVHIPGKFQFQNFSISRKCLLSDYIWLKLFHLIYLRPTFRNYFPVEVICISLCLDCVVLFCDCWNILYLLEISTTKVWDILKTVLLGFNQHESCKPETIFKFR